MKGFKVEDARTVDGRIQVHRKDDKLYAELTEGHFDRNFIVLISIAKGIGRESLLGGMSWGHGDE